jgi:uncharacterized protein YidB (DUF937 family)
MGLLDSVLGTASQLSRMLPGLINHLTPEGQAPEQGLGNGEDLMGMLGGLLQQAR